MPRYVVHLRNTGYEPRNVKGMLHKAREVVDMDVIIRDLRISSKYLEFDVSASGEQIKEVLSKLASISTVVKSTEVVEREMDKEETIKVAKSLFNEERYWECHEALEGVWKNESGNEKNLIQGIILVCAAFVHSQKNEDDVSMNILKRALPKLEIADGNYHGIDVAKMKEVVREMMARRRIDYFKI